MLSKMTRDLLTPPVATVTSEYAFSIGTNIIGDRRITLTINMLEALICLKDWEDGRMRFQTLEDEFKEAFENLDLNADNDVKEIDDEKRRMKIE